MSVNDHFFLSLSKLLFIFGIFFISSSCNNSNVKLAEEFRKIGKVDGLQVELAPITPQLMYQEKPTSYVCRRKALVGTDNNTTQHYNSTTSITSNWFFKVGLNIYNPTKHDIYIRYMAFSFRDQPPGVPNRLADEVVHIIHPGNVHSLTTSKIEEAYKRGNTKIFGELNSNEEVYCKDPNRESPQAQDLMYKLPPGGRVDYQPEQVNDHGNLQIYIPLGDTEFVKNISNRNQEFDALVLVAYIACSPALKKCVDFDPLQPNIEKIQNPSPLGTQVQFKIINTAATSTTPNPTNETNTQTPQSSVSSQ